MKKMMLTIGLLCAACTWIYAELNDAKIQESRDRVDKIKVVKANLESASTGEADIDACKDAAITVTKEVIESGEAMAELYEAMKAGKKPIKESIALAAQLTNEGLEAADLAKTIEPASKATKNLKNPKLLVNAKKIISNSTEASKLTVEEVAFQVQVVNEMVETLKANK